MIRGMSVHLDFGSDVKLITKKCIKFVPKSLNMKEIILIGAFVLGIIFPKFSFCQDSIQLQKINSRLDSIESLLISQAIQNNELKENSNNNIEFASKLVDWTALIFVAITLIFLIAGIIGFRELSEIKNIRNQMEKQQEEMENEIQQIRITKTEMRNEINNIKARLESESKDFLKTVYLLNQGTLNFNNGKLEEAEKLFSEIIKINENDYEATCFLARCYFGQRKYILSLETIKKALKLNEKPSFAYTIMAEIYRRLGKYNESIEAFEKALSITQRKSNYTSLGYSFFRKGEYNNAIEVFQSAMEIRRYSTPACGLAKCYLKLKNISKTERYIDETILLAEEEISKGSMYVWAHYSLAFAFLIKNKKRECIKQLKGALEKNSNPEVIKEQLLDFQIFNEEAPRDLFNNCIKLIENKLNTLMH